jgi:isochorismate hydrolase
MKKRQKAVLGGLVVVVVILAALLGTARGQLASVKAELQSVKAELQNVPPYVESSAVVINPGKTALIIVDMQNDFLKLGGKLGPTDEAGAQYCATIISQVEALLDRCRDADMPVVYTQDYHYPGDPEFAIFPAHCEVGTTGVEIVSELAPEVTVSFVREERQFPMIASLPATRQMRWRTR